MDESSIYLCPAPLYHAAALQWSAGVHEMGGTVVVMERFEAERFLALVERERVTHSQVVPTMLVRALKLPEEDRLRHDLSSLQRVVHAAAPCPIDVKRKMIEWVGPIVQEYYAATEGNGMTFIDRRERMARASRFGRPGRSLGIPHILATRKGTELPTGDSSEPRLLRTGRTALRVPQRRRARQDPGEPPSLASRQLVDAWRHRLPRRRWLPLPHRPPRLHHHFGRREHLPGRDRILSDHAPEGGRRRRLRVARRGDG